MIRLFGPKRAIQNIAAPIRTDYEAPYDGNSDVIEFTAFLLGRCNFGHTTVKAAGEMIVAVADYYGKRSSLTPQEMQRGGIEMMRRWQELKRAADHFEATNDWQHLEDVFKKLTTEYRSS